MFEGPILRAGVPRDEYDDCMRWAFGDKWHSTLAKDADIEWNRHHPGLFQLSSSDYIEEALLRIGQEYLKQNERKRRTYNTVHI